MTNAYGIVLDDASLRWAAAESVPETVIAALCLLETRNVDEIVARLTPAALEQVIKIVGRCPRAYPPGAYEALKGHRRTPSPEHAANVSAVTNRAKVPLNANQRATANPYGITLNRAWTDWAAQHGVSETIAAALYLLSENRKAEEVLVKLAPDEMERVIAVVRRWPDQFPPGALATLKNSRPTSSLEQSAACGSPDEALTRGNVRPTRAYGSAGLRAEIPQRATEHATPTNAEKPGTLPGTLVETARRRMVVEDLMGAGLSVRTISAGTGIPRSSVHRAMRAIARAEAKKEVAIAEIAKALLGKKLRSRAKGL
jgi:hypothetical protein